MHLILLLLTFFCPEAPVSAQVVEAVFMRVAPVLELHLGGQVTRIKHGKIAHITNFSGHFSATVFETLRYPQLFKQAGFDVSGVGLTVFVPKKPTGASRFKGGVKEHLQAIIGG